MISQLVSSDGAHDPALHLQFCVQELRQRWRWQGAAELFLSVDLAGRQVERVAVADGT